MGQEQFLLSVTMCSLRSVVHEGTQAHIQTSGSFSLQCLSLPFRILILGHVLVITRVGRFIDSHLACLDLSWGKYLLAVCVFSLVAVKPC